MVSKPKQTSGTPRKPRPRGGQRKPAHARFFASPSRPARRDPRRTARRARRRWAGFVAGLRAFSSKPTGEKWGDLGSPISPQNFSIRTWAGWGATRAQISRHDSQIGSEDNDFFGERVNASRCYQKRGTPSRQKTHRTRLNLPPRYAASLRPRTRAYHARPSGGRPARRRRRDSAPSRWTWREKNDGPMISLCQAGASNRRRARGDASPYPALATR